MQSLWTQSLRLLFDRVVPFPSLLSLMPNETNIYKRTKKLPTNLNPVQVRGYKPPHQVISIIHLTLINLLDAHQYRRRRHHRLDNSCWWLKSDARSLSVRSRARDNSFAPQRQKFTLSMGQRSRVLPTIYPHIVYEYEYTIVVAYGLYANTVPGSVARCDDGRGGRRKKKKKIRTQMIGNRRKQPVCIWPGTRPVWLLSSRRRAINCQYR